MPEESAPACGGGTLYQKSYQASSVAEAYAEKQCGKLFPHGIYSDLATNALDQLALWVDENCIRKCGYACIRRSASSGYCTLCSYMLQPLACPNKKEISIRQLGMQEEDLVCMRREFK